MSYKHDAQASESPLPASEYGHTCLRVVLVCNNGGALLVRTSRAGGLRSAVSDYLTTSPNSSRASSVKIPVS